MSFVFPTTSRSHLVVGNARTGKTQCLVGQVSGLLNEAACSSEDIMVFAASPDSANALKARLTEVCPSVDAIRIYTPREYALEILSSQAAYQATGRHAHILTRYEESFLREDLKGCGLDPKRLREMVKFFYRSWSDLADFDPDWFATAEEQEVHTLLKNLLTDNKAYVEAEVANCACRLLMEHTVDVSPYSAAYIFVDDYQCLSRASQWLVNLIAKRSIFITSNPWAGVAALDAYPYAAGADELVKHNPDCTIERLEHTGISPQLMEVIEIVDDHAKDAMEQDGVQLLGTICEQTVPEDLTDVAAEKTGNTAPDTFTVFEESTPAAECQRAAEWTQSVIGAGIEPRDVLVVVPNATWERNVATVLTKAGIPCNRAGLVEDISVDIRDMQRCRAARFLCLLILAGYPNDEPSLRAWCGFGEYLTNAQVFREIRLCATDAGVSLRDILDDMALFREDPQLAQRSYQFEFFREADKVVRAFNVLRDYLAQLENLCGETLIRRAYELVYDTDDDISDRLGLIVSSPDEHSDARAVADAIRERLALPTMPLKNAVKIVTAEKTCGLDAQAAYIMGAVNGFYPTHACFDDVNVAPDKRTLMASSRARRFACALGQGEKYCAVSYFTSLPYSNAQAFDLAIYRIFADRDQQMARVCRSMFLNRCTHLPPTNTLDRNDT